MTSMIEGDNGNLFMDELIMSVVWLGLPRTRAAGQRSSTRGKSGIVVIGTSAGGVKVLSKIVEQLPNDLNAAIFYRIAYLSLSALQFIWDAY